jgi:CheY-like chemotaxis protein
MIAMKILLIEDEPDIRDSLREMLELNGHEVVVATGGEEGVRHAKSSQPDFIFCDITMPGLDGFGVLEAVRQLEHPTLVPFVFLTAKTDRANQRHGMALGADDYITKPFSEKEIIEALAARSQRHRPLQERVDALVQQHRRQAGADWSHELLTPLNGMWGGLQLLEMEIDSLNRNDLKEMISLIRGGLERQEKLSRKLIRYFELERIKAAATVPAGFHCPAERAVRAGVQCALAAHHCATDVELRCTAGAVAVPESFLADAVAELVDNALRFSAPGQKVAVTAGPVGAQFRIEILDSGCGMTAEERANVASFNQFGRDKREQQGLGLGLATARLVAEVGGGSLRLDAGAEGRGLRATMLLRVVSQHVGPGKPSFG